MALSEKTLLLVDASINLALGILLLAFPVGIPDALGLPIPTSYFYTSILGAVLIGIGIALLLQRSPNKGQPAGLGLVGAIVINLCGGSALLGWLILSSPGASSTGSIVLWLIALLVIATGLAELIRVTRSTSQG